MEATIATGNIVIGTVIEDAFWRAFDAVKDLGSEIVQVGSKYESSFAQLETIMDTTQMSTEDMSKGLRTLSKEMGISAGDLARTTYNAISATEDTAGSLELVETASKLAVAGFTDSANSLSLLTQAMNAYGKDTYTTTALADSFMQVQNMGVTTIGEMSKYMGRAIGNTQLYGASLADLEKSFIAYTKISPNVRVASTSIAALFKDVGLSGSDAANQLEKATGKTYKQLIGEGHDIRYVLDELYESVGRDDDAFAKLFTGTSRAAATNILKANINDWNRWSEDVENSLNGATSVTDDAFAIMADTAAFKGAQMEQIINDKFITLYEAIGPYLMELKGQFASFVESIDVEQVANTLMSVGDKIMSAIDFVKSNAIPTLEAVAPIILGIVTAMTVWKSYFGALNLVSSISKIASAAQGLWAVLAANPILAVIAVIAGLVTYFVTLYKTNEDFRNKVNEIWENVKTTVTNAVNAIVSFFTTTIPQALDNVKEWFATTWDNIIATMQQWGANVMSFITETIPQWIESIIQFFLTLPSRIGFALGFALGTLIKWGVDLVNWAQTSIPQFIESVVSWFATLPSRIWTWLVGVINNVIAWGSNLISSGLAAASNFLSTVVSVISSLPSRIWTWLGQALNRVADWGSNLASKGRSAIQTMISAISSAAASIPSKMAEIGRNIVQGVWNGIQNAKSWFASQVSGFFSGIVSGAKAALGIHSPSKVFAEIGEFMALGLGVGWNDEYDSVKRDIEDGLTFDAGEISTTVVPQGTGDLLGANGYNQTVIINAPQELSPWEIARQTKNATREMLLNFK